ncbi:MAG TPA: hypothetical protein VFL04_06935 [Rectinemataceae bacterium]|nr:hypothetical protein [Rectinemataceae bacterium]
MASDGRGARLLAAATNPWLWSGLALFLFGLALGQILRALVLRRRGGPASPKAAGIRASLLASLGLLALAALLILPAPEALRSSGLAAWAGAAFALGGFAGFLPMPVGLPLLILAAGSFGLMRSGLAAWLPWDGPGEIARLLPIEVRVEPASRVRAELDLGSGRAEREARMMDLGFASAGLCVEGLELRGPLAALAVLARCDRPPADSGRAARFFRVAGLIGPGEARALLPVSAGPLTRLVGLDALGGFEPGGKAESRALGSLILGRRATSGLQSLEALSPVSFSIDASLVPSASSADQG